jgi:hypothetical protein
VIRNTSLIVVLHNNGCTGIDQPNIYSRRFKMNNQAKEIAIEELAKLSGGRKRKPKPEPKPKPERKHFEGCQCKNCEPERAPAPDGPIIII